jgi:hypothetical protein
MLSLTLQHLPAIRRKQAKAALITARRPSIAPEIAGVCLLIFAVAHTAGWV